MVILFYQTFVLLAFHYVFRYVKLCNPVWLSWIGRKPWRNWLIIGVVSDVVFVGSIFLSCFYGYVPTELSRTAYAPVIKNVYGIDLFAPNEPGFLGIVYWVRTDSGDKEWLLFGLFIISCVILPFFASGVIIVLSTVKIVRELSAGRFVAQAPATKRLQQQLFKTLIVQTIVPCITAYFPLGIIFLVPLTGFAMEGLGTVCMMSTALFPMLDPFIVIFLITGYRKALLRLLKGIREVYSIELFAPNEHGYLGIVYWILNENGEKQWSLFVIISCVILPFFATGVIIELSTVKIVQELGTGRFVAQAPATKRLQRQLFKTLIVQLRKSLIYLLRDIRTFIIAHVATSNAALAQLPFLVPVTSRSLLFPHNSERCSVRSGQMISAMIPQNRANPTLHCSKEIKFCFIFCVIIVLQVTFLHFALHRTTSATSSHSHRFDPRRNVYLPNATFEQVFGETSISDASQSLPSNGTLFCFVLTSPKYHRTRVPAVASTWLRRCDHGQFYTSTPIPDYEHITQNRVHAVSVAYSTIFKRIPDEYDLLFSKTLLALRFTHRMYPEFEWYYKVNLSIFDSQFEEVQSHY
ncbi:hypothetical protein PRIPAC_81549 [Pristionchus pacificus]|uniref:G protein-coupled receptor n=1 Tax=Pristionchus pacificus TaxID=54126 RepID=A0A2A6CPV6_PRIPA|nr:hypothetical protein PRIPAC_81549 [Pristionchus pacificus]|eukprot:PDM80128.1 G protein-coupled receptor [Pristionchus pacificus]